MGYIFLLEFQSLFKFSLHCFSFILDLEKNFNPSHKPIDRPCVTSHPFFWPYICDLHDI